MSSAKYIWPGEESAFVIHRRRRKMATLAVHLTGAPREVLSLKRSVREYANLSILKLVELVRSSVLELGPYRAQEAAERAARLEREGLRVSLNGFIQESSLLMNERISAALLIEDNEENRRVIEDAIRRGVRVVDKEA